MRTASLTARSVRMSQLVQRRSERSQHSHRECVLCIYKHIHSGHHHLHSGCSCSRILSGFGMECWGLKVWGSSESWVRVRVTGGGSPRINLMYHGLVPKGTTKDVHFIVVCNCSFHPKVSSLPTFPAL